MKHLLFLICSLFITHLSFGVIEQPSIWLSRFTHKKKPDSIPLPEQTTKKSEQINQKSGRGISNPGNACYAISTIQALKHLKEQNPAIFNAPLSESPLAKIIRFASTNPNLNIITYKDAYTELLKIEKNISNTSFLSWLYPFNTDAAALAQRQILRLNQILQHKSTKRNIMDITPRSYKFPSTADAKTQALARIAVLKHHVRYMGALSTTLQDLSANKNYDYAYDADHFFKALARDMNTNPKITQEAAGDFLQRAQSHINFDNPAFAQACSLKRVYENRCNNCNTRKLIEDSPTTSIEAILKPHTSTMDHCIQDYLAEEQLNQVYCETCKQKFDHTRNSTITKWPDDILIIQIKRQDGNLQQNLDLCKVWNPVKNPGVVYQLKAIVMHSCESTNSGHYTTYTIHDNYGLYYNDSKCRLIQQQNLDKIISGEHQIIKPVLAFYTKHTYAQIAKSYIDYYNQSLLASEKNPYKNSYKIRQAWTMPGISFALSSAHHNLGLHHKINTSDLD